MKTNWKYITRSILEQKTIVFLGPGLTYNASQPGQEAQFLSQLAQQNQEKALAYHERDGFLIFPDKNAQLLCLDQITPFYEQFHIHPVLGKLAEIPFHLIIQLTPDMSLCKVFEDKDFDFVHHYYLHTRKIEISDAFHSERPLLYNLLGSVKDYESLITSHFDLFNYVRSIYANNNLPEVLKEAFTSQETQNILFLGLDFEKWYFPLLLHMLRLDFDPCIRYAATQGTQVDGMAQILYESNFKISFVSDDIGVFIDNLHQQFDTDQLRKPPQAESVPQVPIKNNIMKFLSKAFNAGDFEIFCFLNYGEVYKEFVPEMGQSNRIKRLMEYVERQEGYAELIALAREENPHQYENCSPYYEKD